MSRAGGATVGDRTFLDALAPAVAEVGAGLDAAAVDRAIRGAESTQNLVGRRGRSSYLGDKALGVPDPSAVPVASLLLAMVERLTHTSLDSQRVEIARLRDS